MPHDCRQTAALGPLFVKVVAQRSSTRHPHWVIASSQPLRDEPVALKDRHVIWWEFFSMSLH